MKIIRFVMALALFLSPILSGQGKIYYVTEFGAAGNGVIDDTESLQTAIDACAKGGGGTVSVPPGIYKSRSLYLKSNINLYLDPGAMIKGSDKLEGYPLETDGSIGGVQNALLELNTGESTVSGESDRAGVITAYKARNVSITGQGIIDGNAMAFHDKTKMHWGDNVDIDNAQTRQGDIYMDPQFALHDPLAHGERPGNLIRFIDCVDVRVQDVTFQNSPTWTFQIHKCENVTVQGIRVNSFDSELRIPNDDGINIQHSSLVHISDCDIHTGDDCIANFDVNKVTVTNCTLSARSSAIRVGDTRGDIYNCTFSNLVIYNANRAIGVYARASGSVSNVLFSNILIKNQLFTGHWWGQGEPIHVSALPSNFFGFEEKLGRIKDVRFQNIIAETENGILVHGCDESIIENLSFDNVKLIVRNSPLNDQFGGNFDLRHTTGFKQALFAHDIPGFYCNYVNGLELKDFSIEWADDLPGFFTNAIFCENFQNVIIDGFKGKAAHDEHASISIKAGSDISIKNCKAEKGTETFLVHENITDYRMFFGNDLADANQAMIPAKSEFVMFGNYLPK